MLWLKYPVLELIQNPLSLLTPTCTRRNFEVQALPKTRKGSFWGVRCCALIDGPEGSCDPFTLLRVTGLALVHCASPGKPHMAPRRVMPPPVPPPSILVTLLVQEWLHHPTVIQMSLQLPTRDFHRHEVDSFGFCQHKQEPCLRMKPSLQKRGRWVSCAHSGITVCTYGQLLWNR